ncbi:hypothetical protein ONE63_003174 [Megalurothrips usitatus]|uniref:Uncharacterized protein n=1 Tax=Megalurothrips usitatus TaxID=439358 RepID=A0AAV7XA64_9NEOP|nr:hypothetical protein ONE63_003174 [Megalurothrips usitatus]
MTPPPPLQGGPRGHGLLAARPGLRPGAGRHAEDGGRGRGPGPPQEQERRRGAGGRRRAPCAAEAADRAGRVPGAGAHGLPAALRHQRHHLLHGRHLPSGGQLCVAVGVHHGGRRRAGGGLGRVLRRGGPRRPPPPARLLLPLHGPLPGRARRLLPRVGRGRGRRGVGRAAGDRPLRLHLLLLVGLRAAAVVHDGRAAARRRQGLGHGGGHRHQLGPRIPGDQHVRGGGGRGGPRPHLCGLRRRLRGGARLRGAPGAGDQGPLPGGHPGHAPGRQAVLTQTYLLILFYFLNKFFKCSNFGNKGGTSLYFFKNFQMFEIF